MRRSKRLLNQEPEYAALPLSKKAKTDRSANGEAASDGDVDLSGDISSPGHGSTTSDTDDWPDEHLLSQVTLIRESESNKTARLELILEVYADPNRLRSRLGYRFQLLHVRERPKDKGKKRADTPDPDRIGYIKAWRLDKFDNKQSAKRDFKREMMATFAGRMVEVESGLSHKYDAALMMQGLYNKACRVQRDIKKRHGDARANELLLRNPLIFVEAVHILPKFRGKRWLGKLLRFFHYMLNCSEITEWHRFAGTIVLGPAPLKSKRDSWPIELSDEQIVEILVKAYAKYGKYEDWGNITISDGVHDLTERLMLRTVWLDAVEPLDDHHNGGGGGEDGEKGDTDDLGEGPSGAGAQSQDEDTATVESSPSEAGPASSRSPGSAYGFGQVDDQAATNDPDLMAETSDVESVKFPEAAGTPKASVGEEATDGVRESEESNEDQSEWSP